MENCRSPCSLTSFLLCNESLECFEDTENEREELDCVSDDRCDDDHDYEYIKTLCGKETAIGVLQFQDSSWIARAHLDGIQYIIKKSVILGFKLQTAYVSVTYLDRFLSRRSIEGDENNSWAMRLLSVACLSLAAKMDEISVPPLPHLCGEDYNFESQVIQKMELVVLSELGWSMGSITPFSFVEFFAKKFCVDMSKLEEVILGTMGDVKIKCYKPSVVAAAATMFILDRGFTTDALQNKIGPVALRYSFDTENIVSCYHLLQEEELERSSKVSEVEPSASSSITPCSKRKRPVLNRSDLFEDSFLSPSTPQPRRRFLSSSPHFACFTTVPQAAISPTDKPPAAKMSTEHGEKDDPTQSTFSLTDEDHTLANSLRYILNQDPRVTFCGYSIPHPSDARVNLRVQTTGDTSREVLVDSCQDLTLVCQHVRSTFDQAVKVFKNKQSLESMDIK